MKTITIAVMFLFALFATPSVILRPCQSTFLPKDPVKSADASARHPEVQQEQFEGSAAWQKLDLRFREAWKAADAEGDTGRMFECLIKIDEPKNKDNRAMLSGAGFMPRTFAGSIVTGSVRAGNVPDVARLPFVKVMELAVPLKLKKK